MSALAENAISAKNNGLEPRYPIIAATSARLLRAPSPARCRRLPERDGPGGRLHRRSAESRRRRDPKLCCGVRRIFVRSVLGFLEREARRQGQRGARSGAVIFVQRFGSALNLNLHFHALVIDGAYASTSPFARPDFHPAPPLEDEDVAQLTQTLQRRVTRYLQRKARLPREPSEADDSACEPELLALISAASVQGQAALPADSKPPALRLGARREVRKPLGA